MLTEKQIKKLANGAVPTVQTASPTPGPADAMPDAYWDSVLRDPRGRAQVVPIEHLQLSQISRHVLRVWCRKCDRTVEIQTADAIRLFGKNVTWKDGGRKILESSCQNRTGHHEDDGCWAAYE